MNVCSTGETPVLGELFQIMFLMSNTLAAEFIWVLSRFERTWKLRQRMKIDTERDQSGIQLHLIVFHFALFFCLPYHLLSP